MFKTAQSNTKSRSSICTNQKSFPINKQNITDLNTDIYNYVLIQYLDYKSLINLKNCNKKIHRKYIDSKSLFNTHTDMLSIRNLVPYLNQNLSNFLQLPFLEYTITNIVDVFPIYIPMDPIVSLLPFNLTDLNKNIRFTVTDIKMLNLDYKKLIYHRDNLYIYTYNNKQYYEYNLFNSNQELAFKFIKNTYKTNTYGRVILYSKSKKYTFNYILKEGVFILDGLSYIYHYINKRIYKVVYIKPNSVSYLDIKDSYWDKNAEISKILNDCDSD